MLTRQLLPRKPCDHQEENKQEPNVPATIKIDRPGTSHGQQRVDQIKCGSETSSEHDVDFSSILWNKVAQDFFRFGSIFFHFSRSVDRKSVV